MTATADDIRKLAEWIKDIHFAMLTTVDSDGSLHSRPMATQQIEFDGDLWFFTKASSHKAMDVQRDAHANVSYADPDNNRYISVSGMAQLVRDPAKARALWNPMYKAWFPEGLDDPDLALLRIEVRRAEYWDSPSSAAAHLLGIAKATLTGKEYQPGENREVEFRS